MNSSLDTFVASLITALSKRLYGFVLIQTGTFITGLFNAHGIERSDSLRMFWSSSLDRHVYDTVSIVSFDDPKFLDLFATPSFLEVLFLRAEALVQEGYFDAAKTVVSGIQKYFPENKVAERLAEALKIYSLEKFFDITKGSQKLFDDSQPLRVWKLQNATISDKKGPIITSEGSFVGDASPTNYLSSLQDIIVRKSSETTQMDIVIPLQSSSANNFWHWCIEQLPRVVTAQALNLDGKFLVVAKSDFIIETLAALGVSLSRVVETEHRIDIKAHQTYFIEHPDYSPAHESTYRTIREKVVSYCREKKRASHSVKRLYVSRRGARVVLNEDKVIELLKEYGFEVVCFDDLSFIDQVSLTSEAEVFIGPHGASFTHALFLPDRSSVIELFSPNYVNPCMTHINQFFGHKYHMIVSKNRVRHYSHGDDIDVPLDVLRLTLENL